MRSWETEISLTCEEGRKRSSIMCYKTYTFKEARDIANHIRRRESADRSDRRKFVPVFTYLLEAMVQDYLAGRARHGDILCKITIKDSKHAL